MADSFEKQLKQVQGKVFRVNIADPFERKRDGLLYYWNHANRLHSGALIISDAGGPQEVFALLAGLSMELLLKGIHRAFDKQAPHSHGLYDLSKEVGITVTPNDKVILDALSEHVLWASRYPTPTKPSLMFRAMRIFEKQRRGSGNLTNYYLPERDISRTNYDRLWERFATYYQQAREARIESAEFQPQISN